MVAFLIRSFIMYQVGQLRACVGLSFSPLSLIQLLDRCFANLLFVLFDSLNPDSDKNMKKNLKTK